jgi:hypothetical protein
MQESVEKTGKIGEVMQALKVQKENRSRQVKREQGRKRALQDKGKTSKEGAGKCGKRT